MINCRPLASTRSGGTRLSIVVNVSNPDLIPYWVGQLAMATRAVCAGSLRRLDRLVDLGELLRRTLSRD